MNFKTFVKAFAIVHLAISEILPLLEAIAAEKEKERQALRSVQTLSPEVHQRKVDEFHEGVESDFDKTLPADGWTKIESTRVGFDGVPISEQDQIDLSNV